MDFNYLVSLRDNGGRVDRLEEVEARQIAQDLNQLGGCASVVRFTRNTYSVFAEKSGGEE